MTHGNGRRATFSSPLFVAAAAVLAVDPGEAAQPAVSTRDEILDRIIEREQSRHWHGCPSASSVIQQQVVAVATLFGADRDAEMADHLDQLPALSGDGSRAARYELAFWIHGLYHGLRWASPLEPDLLGERLVSQHLTAPLTDYAMSLKATPSGTRAITVLSRLCATSQVMGDAVRATLSRHLTALGDAAVQQEIMADGWGVRGLLAEPLAALIDAAGLDVPPWPTIVTAAGPATVLLSYRIDLRAIAAYRDLVDASPADYQSDLARWLNSAAVDLGALGRFEEAIDPIREAVDIYRTLAESNPGYIPDLARSLNNFAVRLGAVGMTDEALEVSEECVKIRRVLVETDSESYLPNLARSLSNLAIRRLESGDRDGALEVVEEAVKIRQELVSANSALHLRDLARSYANLSTCLAAFGRRTEALTAIELVAAIRRDLSKTSPVVYLPLLATSLHEMAWHLSVLKRYSDGLLAIEEAVRIRRQFADSNPIRYLPILADSLFSLSKRLNQVGRQFEGDAAFAEGSAIRDGLRVKRG